MNQIVQQQAQLPAGIPAHLAHLYQQPVAFNLGADVAAGISSAAHNRISIKQSRWRLMDTQGNEQVLQTFNLDVLIVDANPHTSKMYYEGSYDPSAADNIAPRCWSDNGIAPSDRVSNPCAYVCASCPMNVFGSKITPAGKKARACADSKRLAVVLADNPDGIIYELRVPAASLTNMAQAIGDMVKRGVRAETLVWRLLFDPQAEFPKITFQPLNWVNEAQMAAVARLMGTKETADLVNKDDRPMDGTARALQPAAAPAQLAAPPVPQAAPNLQAPSYAAQPAPMQQAPQQYVQPQVAPVPQQYAPSMAPAAQAPSTFGVAPAQPMASGNPGMIASPSNVAPANPLGLAMPPMPVQQPQVPIQAQAMAEGAPKKKRRSSAEVAAEKAAAAQAAGGASPQQVVAAMPVQQPQMMPAAAPAAAPMGFNSLPPLPQSMPAMAPAAAVQQYIPPQPAANDVPHAMAAAAAVPVHPQPTSLALDGLLAGLPLG